jgi:hypothetical protein
MTMDSDHQGAELTEEEAHDEPIKFIDIAEFRSFGYLQEVNRQFLHPLGLALSVDVAEDGTETLAGIWDYRDDPEGMNYGPGMIDRQKIERVQRHAHTMGNTRVRSLGYVVQEADL